MNLLIVDDEIVTTQVLEEQLDRELLSIDQIYVAYNTSMARDILQKNKVELILCDIEMPKENGIHFLKWVREQKIQTEVIFLTSHEKFEYAYGAVQNGAANYLLKPIDMNKINQTLLRVTEKIVWKQKTEEIREYWESGIRKMVRYFWTRVLLEPGVQKQGLEEEIKQQGIEEEIQEKYCVVILHFASGKLDLGKEKGQESIYKFAMENILAEAFTEKIKMENVICWEENKGTYLGILSEFSEKETKERAEQVRNIFEKYFPETLQIGYISPSVPFYEVGLEKFLSILKMEGVWMYVATATHRRLTEKALKTAGIDHYFRGIVTSADAGNHKSESADIYEMAMRRLQSNKRDTVVFEDALHAIRTAKAAGFRVAGVYEATAEQDQPEIQRLCDYYIRSYEELVQSETF